MLPMLPYLRLMRPANIVTAMADILLGYAVAGRVASYPGQWPVIAVENLADLGFLLLSTVGLYGGGVVLNDVFDADLDRVERPERPIPSGAAGIRGASLLGILLLLMGVGAAAQVGTRSATLAFLVASLAVIYDAYGKHHPFFGPLNMGACRSGNVLLGMSALPIKAIGGWVAAAPLLYIFAVTLISRGEVSGSGRRPLWLGTALYGIVTGLLLLINSRSGGSFLLLAPFLALFAGMILPPLAEALRQPSGPAIGRAVRAGVLALIAMDASLCLPFAGWPFATLILLLLPLSAAIARGFAVT